MEFSRKKRTFKPASLVLFLVCVLMLQSQVGNPKVDNFLKALSTFPTADAARVALQNARLTEAEQRQLEAGLRQPSYSTQIDRLIKTVKMPPTAPTPPLRDALSLKQEQIQRIDGLNKRLSTEAQGLQAISAKAVSSTALQAAIGITPKITSLSQATIEPGQQLIIRGTDFLPQGSVAFTFGSSSFNGTVVYWANDFILVTFPSGIQGIPEMDGNVTVRKQNARRADAAIRFVPIWQYTIIHSDLLTYSDNPYNSAVAFYLWLVNGQNEWCSQFNIPWNQSTPIWLINGYTIFNLQYVNNSNGWLTSKNENAASYVGSVNLPLRTTGSLCHYIMNKPRLSCVVTVKGPLGLSVYQ